uniref:Uncharacterized protein n=1 Tax=Anopheles minimus TaxID=112268 RepID=A0A182WNY6_9DIPT
MLGLSSSRGNELLFQVK